MGLAEIDARETHRIADRAIVAGQLGTCGKIYGGEVIPEGNPHGACVRCVRMIEVPAIVAAEHPKFEPIVQR